MLYTLSLMPDKRPAAVSRCAEVSALLMINPARGGALSVDRAGVAIFQSGRFRRAVGLERVQQEQGDAHGDGGIGDVEGGPVPVAVVDIQEVDDVAVEDAVDQVAQRAAQHQRPSHGLPMLAGVELAQPDGDEGAGDHRQDDEEPALPAPGSREEAEGRALVAQIGELEEGRQFNRLMQLHRGVDHPLGDLIDDDDEGGQPEPDQHGAYP